MTFLVNDPLAFAPQSLRGFVLSHQKQVQAVPGGVLRADQSDPGQVAVVVGGGSGHYPAFAGWVGPGLAHAAVCGNVFASPSASQVRSVAKAAHTGAGVLLLFGNYAGDVLQFGDAADELNQAGIDTRIVTISDDVASAPAERHLERRGIAGDLMVVKAAGAAAAQGLPIAQVEALARKANQATRSLGIAFDSCTVPGADQPLFEVPTGSYELGLGIHGEPGLSTHPMAPANQIAEQLVDGVLAEEPEPSTDYNRRVAVLLNGLGATKYEELFVLYGAVADLLEARGLQIVDPVVDEQVTSLDMAGVSLSVMFLDEQLEALWSAPCSSPAFSVGTLSLGTPRVVATDDAGDAIKPGSPESAAQARQVCQALAAMARCATANEDKLAQMDAVAGDGDHGRGMVLGSKAACQAADRAAAAGAGARTVLAQAAAAWAEGAGGTSGALWGRGLRTVAEGLSDDDATPVAKVLRAVIAGAEAIAQRGGASVGDKTMVDASAPFAQQLAAALDQGASPAQAWQVAVQAASDGAAATAKIIARLGRAKTHGDASLGTPDPGAVSFSLLMGELSSFIKQLEPTNQEKK